MITQSLIKRRSWNPQLYDKVKNTTILSVLSPFIKKHGLMIDVGGNSGYHTYWHQQHNKVITYEAVPEMCEILKQNLQKLNALDNVIIKNAAVGNRNTEIDFFVDMNRMSMSSQISLVDNTDKIKIPMVTLDSEHKQDSNINFIKIDVEGFEISVLEGCKNIIDNQKPMCMVEIYKPWCDKTGTPIKNHFEFFFDRNYVSFYFDNKINHLILINDIQDAVNCIENKHHLHDGDILFVPW